MTTTPAPPTFTYHARNCTCVPCLLGEAFKPSTRDEDLPGRAVTATTVCAICLGPIRVPARKSGPAPTARGWEHAPCTGATETAFRMMASAR